MTLYQPAIERYKYSFWKGKWVFRDMLFSSLVFDSLAEAESHRDSFLLNTGRLLNHGRPVKLKDGSYRFFVAELRY